MNTLHAHLFAIATPILAAISQVIIKWQTIQAGQLPIDFSARILFIVELLIRPWVIIALFATFMSGVCWILAMTKLELSYAYPYVAAPFIVVPLLAVILFGESITAGKIIGSAFVLLGIAIVTIKG